MKRLLCAAVLLFPLPAFAGDDIAKLLADLASEDPAVRTEAEQALWNASGDAYETCRKALESTTDPEVESRLRPIVNWLRLASRLPDLLAANRERWFLSRKNGKVTHTWRQCATLQTVDGHRIWVLETRMQTATADGVAAFNATTRIRHDRVFSPVASTIEVVHPAGRHFVYNRFQKNGVFTRVSPSPEWTLPLPAADDSGEPPQLPVEALILLLEIAGIQESASVSWRPVMHLMPWAILDMVERSGRSRSERPEVTFTAERGAQETVKVGGREVRAWKYAVAAWPVAFWVSPTEGVVRMSGGGFETEVSTREACEAAGLIPEARRKLQVKALVPALEEAARRDEAEQALLKLPEALGLCRERLAAGADGETKVSLERVGRWLDPEFKRTELAAMWGERCFLDTSDPGGARCAVWQAAKEESGPEGRTWSWDCAASRKGKAALTARWRGRTRSDAWLTPVEVRVDVLMDHWGVRSASRLQDDFLVLENEAGGWREPESIAVRDAATDAALVPDAILGAVVERAALAGLARFEARVLLAMNQRAVVHPVIVTRMGEETLSWEGESVAVVRYRAADGPLGEVSWFVEPARGILRMTYAGMTLDRSTPEALAAAGFKRPASDPDDVQQLLARIRDGKKRERESATARLLHSGTAAPEVDAAAAAATDPACRERLEAISRWLDPAFGREKLAVLGRARRFTTERNGAATATITMSARPSTSGPGWKFEVKGMFPPLLNDIPVRVESSPGMEGRRITIDLTGTEDREIFEAELCRTGLIIHRQQFNENGELESDDAGDWNQLRGDVRWHPTIGPTLWFLVERASLARLEYFEACQWNFLPDKVERHVFRFAGEADVEKPGGGQVKARKYVRGAGRSEHTFFVSDDLGLLKGELGAEKLKVEVVPGEDK